MFATRMSFRVIFTACPLAACSDRLTNTGNLWSVTFMEFEYEGRVAERNRARSGPALDTRDARTRAPSWVEKPILI